MHVPYNPSDSLIPLDPCRSYDVAPLGVVLSHEDVGQVQDYCLENGYHTWKAIITEVRREPDPDSPYLFSIVSGMANSHTQIAHAAKLETLVVTHNLPELGATGVHLRLEADEFLNGTDESEKLFAEVDYTRDGQPSIETLRVGASLLQAARSLPAPFDKLPHTFILKTFSVSPMFEGRWKIEDGRRAVPD